MLELSVFAEVIVVLAGFVQRYTEAAIWVAVGVGDVTEKVTLAPTHAFKLPVLDVIVLGVGGK